MSFLYQTFTNKSGQEILISYQDKGKIERQVVRLADNDTAIQVSTLDRTWRVKDNQGNLWVEFKTQNQNTNYIIPASSALPSEQLSSFIIYNKFPYSIKIYSIDSNAG